MICQCSLNFITLKQNVIFHFIPHLENYKLKQKKNQKQMINTDSRTEPYHYSKINGLSQLHAYIELSLAC